jgi:hypothetical protein
MSEIGSGDPKSQVIGEGPIVASMTSDQRLAHLAGAIGIVGQLASAYFYLLFPLLIVPTPTSYAFFVTWLVLVGLTIIWWRHHPIRSFFVPIVSVPAVLVVFWIGTTFLGWSG